MDIRNRIISFLLPLLIPEAAIIVIAMLPVFELRLSIPLAVFQFHFSIIKAYILSITGNIIIIVPLLVFFRYLFHELENIGFVGKILKWWFSSVNRRSKVVEKWGFWGLVLFVSIPLPGTGAWSGAIAANLFNFHVKKAFVAITMGVLIAGVLVALASMGVIKLWEF